MKPNLNNPYVRIDNLHGFTKEQKLRMKRQLRKTTVYTIGLGSGITKGNVYLTRTEAEQVAKQAHLKPSNIQGHYVDKIYYSDIVSQIQAGVL